MTVILVLVLGASLGLAVIATMTREGMLETRGAATVLLVAIASFYPVFAVMSGNAVSILFHLVILAIFGALAVRACRTSTPFLAGGLIAHGIFDLVLLAPGSVAPGWWHPFCAGFDIAAGGALLFLIDRGRVPA